MAIKQLWVAMVEFETSPARDPLFVVQKTESAMWRKLLLIVDPKKLPPGDTLGERVHEYFQQDGTGILWYDHMDVPT